MLLRKGIKTIRGSITRGRTTLGNNSKDIKVRITSEPHTGKIRINGEYTYDLAFIFRELAFKFFNEKECNEIDCAFINMSRQLRQITPDNILDLIYKIKELKETQLGKEICDENGNVIKVIPGKYQKYKCDDLLKGPGQKRRKRFEDRLKELSILLRTYLNKDNILETIYKIKEMDDEYSQGSKAKLGELKNTTCCNPALPDTFKTHLCNEDKEFICPGDDEEETETKDDDCGCS